MPFELYPLQKKIWTQKILSDIRLYKIFAYEKNITEEVNEEVRQRLHTKTRPNWVVLQIVGETGELKSSTGISFTKQKLDPNFGPENICMQYAEFEKAIAKSKPRESYMLDEQVFQRGLGSTRVRENLVNIVETLRKRQNCLVLITPKEKAIQDENVTFTFEPCGFDEKTKTVRLLVRKNYYLGFYYLKLDWNSKLWKDYEKKKDEFIEATAKQKYKKFDYDEYAQELVKKMPEAYKEKKKRVVLWVEKNSPNITKEERDLLVEQVNMLLETGG